MADLPTGPTDQQARRQLLAKMRRSFATGTPGQAVGVRQADDAKSDDAKSDDATTSSTLPDDIQPADVQPSDRNNNNQPGSTQPTSVQPADTRPDSVVEPHLLNRYFDALDEALTETEQHRTAPPTKELESPQPAESPKPTESPQPPESPKPTESPQLPETTESAELAAAGLASAEHESRPEIPVEVENYLHHAEEHPDHLPREIVVGDDHSVKTVPRTAKTPVVVLPFTPEIEERGRKKSPKFSIRWLVEWGHKLMKKFAGRIIYRHDEPDDQPDAQRDAQQVNQLENQPSTQPINQHNNQSIPSAPHPA